MVDNTGREQQTQKYGAWPWCADVSRRAHPGTARVFNYNPASCEFILCQGLAKCFMQIFSLSLPKTRRGRFYHPHFTEEEIEALGVLGSLSQPVTERKLRAKPSAPCFPCRSQSLILKDVSIALILS